MSVLETIDRLVLGDRCNLATAPYLRDLLKVLQCDENKQLILEVIQGLLVVLEDHGCQRLNVAALQLCRFFAENSQFINKGNPEAISLCKYLTALPMSHYAQGELLGKVRFCQAASLPDGCKSFEPSGQFRNFYRRRLLSSNSRAKNLKLWWSWFQVKRNTPVVSESFVMSCYKKHRTMLSRPDPCPDAIVRLGDCQFHPADLVREEIAACARTLTDGKEDFIRYAPQRKACYEYSQNLGGQRRAVRDYLISGSDPCPPILSPSKEFFKLDWFPYIRSRNLLTNVLVTTYVHYAAYQSLSVMSSIAHERLLESEVPAAKVYGICEPLKVRIITKGPGILYWRCKHFQKQIWSALRRFSHFRLIGRPIGATDLTTPGRFMASVDYSAATDGSSQAVGMKLLTSILYHPDCRLDFNATESAIACLGPHHLEYPDAEIPDVYQTNGQLMGSIMSFVILCLLNLCTLRVAEMMTGFVPCDPLINGDDMFYSCDNVSFWEVQNLAARAMGLEPSVGKCYLSEHCASMNSVAFHRDRQGHVKRVDYLPVGLLHGKHKVGREVGLSDDDFEGGEPLESLSQNSSLFSCTDLILAGASRPCSVLSRFLVYNKVELNQELKGRNLFLPYWLGGGGQHAPPHWRVRVTEHQVQLAYSRLRRLTSHTKLCHAIGPREKYVFELEKEELEVCHWTVETETERAPKLWEQRPTEFRNTLPVCLRRKLSLRPYFVSAASGCSGQISQNGARKTLNTSVPSGNTLRRETARESPIFTGVCKCCGSALSEGEISLGYDHMPGHPGSAVMYSPWMQYQGSLTNNERYRYPVYGSKAAGEEKQKSHVKGSITEGCGGCAGSGSEGKGQEALYPADASLV